MVKYKNNIAESTFQCKVSMAEYEKELAKLGFSEIQKISHHSENIKALYAEIENIEMEIQQL